MNRYSFIRICSSFGLLTLMRSRCNISLLDSFAIGITCIIWAVTELLEKGK